MKRNITLYQQIAMHFEQQIREGNLPPGTKLPPTTELAKHFKVNPETIQLGLRLLINQGLINRAPKRGTYVMDNIRRKTLGIVFPNDFYVDPNGAVFPAYLAHLARYAATHGWQSRYFLTTQDEKLDLAFYELRKAVEAGEIGGIANVLYYQSAVSDYLKSDCHVPRVPVVDVDFSQMLPLGLDTLIQRGCERIEVFFPCGDDSREQSDREAAAMLEHYRKSPRCGSAALHHHTVLGHYHEGYRTFKKFWLQSKRRPQGILICNDSLFRGIWYAIMELRINVPDELAVISHVNKGLVPMTHIPLTALEISPEEKAVCSFDAFLARLEGKAAPLPRLQARLIKGKTC